MSPRHALRFVCVVGVSFTVCAAPVGAQQLDLSAYVGAGENVAVSTDDGSDGIYLGLHGNLGFERQAPTRTIAARVGGSLRYFPDTRHVESPDRSASFGLDAQLGPRTRLLALQTLQYSPYRQFGASFFPSASVGSLPTYNPEGAATYGSAFYDVGTFLSLARRITRRSTIGVDYAFRVSLADAAYQLPISHRAGVSFQHALTRYASLRLGTAYRTGRTGFAETALPTKAQDFDIGINYNRPLTFSRGTTLSFSTGTSLVSRPPTALEPTEVAGRQLLAIAGVTLNQSFGRYWGAQLGADRDLQYVDGFPDPFYATRVSSGISGEIGRRFTLLAGASYSTGSGVVSTVRPQTFDGFQTHARIGYRLSRRWQGFGAVYTTRNRLSQETVDSLPPGTVVRPNQSSVQVGVSFSSG